MLKVALTGNVASGKTTLSRIWAREGVPLVLADDLARAAVEPGTEGLAAVVEAFGTGVLREDGELDRGAMRTLVLRDPKERERLEGILHPLILARRDAWLEERETEGTPLAVAEIPLLFEVGLEGDFDLVVLVDAPDEVRFGRLVEERGFEADEAKGLMEAQMALPEKRERADFIVYNGGSREELEIHALALLDLLRARAAGRGSS
jgi:dephospho-CoA kinase